MSSSRDTPAGRPANDGRKKGKQRKVDLSHVPQRVASTMGVKSSSRAAAIEKGTNKAHTTSHERQSRGYTAKELNEHVVVNLESDDTDDDGGSAGCSTAEGLGNTFDEQSCPMRNQQYDTWGAEDLDRLDFNVYEDLAKPGSCVNFMKMVRDYMNHLRRLAPNRVEGEHESAQRFVELINNDIAWPLVKTIVAEFRHPITDTNANNFALQYVLTSVQARTLENKVRNDYIPEYEQKLTWDRVKASIAYLSFIKNDGSAATTVQELDEMVSEMKDAMQRSGTLPSDLLTDTFDADPMSQTRKLGNRSL